MVDFYKRQQLIKQARQTAIPPMLLKWRIDMGFPVQHLRATDIIDGQYTEGRFTQVEKPVKKPEKTPAASIYPPRHTPAVTSLANGVKIIRKKSKLKNRVGI